MNWRSHPPRAPFLDAGTRALLQERGSLTLRLCRPACHFVVRCLRQRTAPLSPDEADCLGLRAGQVAWEREVLLIPDGRPAVFAHTVMPYCPRHPFDQRFAALRGQPLGKLLFSDPRVLRGPLEFRCLDGRDALYRRVRAALENHAPTASIAPPPKLCARRSRFTPPAKGVLVTEIFLPAAIFSGQEI
jgi:chorismate--pyruvate lyase